MRTLRQIVDVAALNELYRDAVGACREGSEVKVRFLDKAQPHADADWAVEKEDREDTACPPPYFAVSEMRLDCGCPKLAQETARFLFDGPALF